MRVVFDHGQICRDHRIQQGNEHTKIFEPTNESAVCWSATHSYNFIIRVKQMQQIKNFDWLDRNQSSLPIL